MTEDTLSVAGGLYCTSFISQCLRILRERGPTPDGVAVLPDPPNSDVGRFSTWRCDPRWTVSPNGPRSDSTEYGVLTAPLQ